MNMNVITTAKNNLKFEFEYNIINKIVEVYKFYTETITTNSFSLR